MKLDRREIGFEKPHILNDQRVNARVPGVPGELRRGFNLFIPENGVESHHDAAAEAVRRFTEPRNILKAVPGRGPADIDSVRAVAESLDTDVRVLRGREEFQCLRIMWHVALKISEIRRGEAPVT